MHRSVPGMEKRNSVESWKDSLKLENLISMEMYVRVSPLLSLLLQDPTQMLLFQKISNSPGRLSVLRTLMHE